MLLVGWIRQLIPVPFVVARAVYQFVGNCRAWRETQELHAIVDPQLLFLFFLVCSSRLGSNVAIFGYFQIRMVSLEYQGMGTSEALKGILTDTGQHGIVGTLPVGIVTWPIP